MDFQKKDWQFRDIISENELNRMEDGIEEGITKAEQAQQTATDAQTNLDNHVSATTGVHGATSAATPNTIVQRDPAGRFKAAAPAEADDVARKAETDAALTAAQNAQATADAALPKSGGAVSGDLIINGALRTRNSADAIYVGDDAIIEDFDQANSIRIKGQQNPAAGDIFISTNNWKVWHSGNDGAGSGLDADLLDGAQLSGDANAWTVAQRMGDGAIKAAGWGFQIMSPYGTANYIGVGNGDGASYTTHNIKFRGHWGMGMYDYADNCNGYYDFRAGKWDVKGGYYVNGNTVWHAGNFPYEVGNWTPNVEIGGINASYASRSGTYIRIGDLVYWTFHVELSSKNGGTGAITIGAFPFPIAPANGTIPMGKINGAAFPSWVYWAHLLVPWDGATFFYLQASGNFYGDYALTGDHIANNSILAASGVCRILP